MAEPLIQLIFKGSIVSTTKLVKPETFIGRLPENDIMINNMGVSRRHARIVNEDDTFYIEDLDSANGMTVDGVRVKRHEFKPGDEVVISKHKLVFQMAKRGVAGFFSDDEKKEADPFAGGQTVFSSTPPPSVAHLSPESEAPEAPPTEEPKAPETPAPGGPQIEVAPPKAKTPDELAHEMAMEIMDTKYGLMLMFKEKILATRGLRKNVTTIGRAKENDITIDNVGVSRLHAQIVKEEEEYLIMDQDSQNGIKVNGVQVKKSPLYPGDEVIVGKHKIIFDLSSRIAARLDGKDIKPYKPDQPDGFVTGTMALGNAPHLQSPAPSPGTPGAPAIGPRAEASPLDKYAIRLTLGDRDIETYKLTKRVTCIGRLKENDIAIDNIGVSRLHAKIVIEDNGQCYVEDQESANGILVNNLPLKRSPLYPGDMITIGKHKLVIELAHKVQATAEARSAGKTDEVWQADSTMMLSEADRDKMRKRWKEMQEKEEAAKEEAGKPQSAKPSKKEKKAAAKKTEAPASRSGKAASGPAAPGAGIARLIMQNAETFEIKSDSTTVGSAESADIRLDFPSIKGKHVTITRAIDDTFRIKCHGWFTKVKVNGNPIKKGEIKHMDKLKIGDQELKFEVVRN